MAGILLAATTDKLQVITGQAVTVDVHVSFVDYTSSTGASSGDKQNTAITTAATTDVVAVPGAGVVRNVKVIGIRNKHASSQVDVTAQYNQNGTTFELHKATLNPGDLLQFIEGLGWMVVLAKGTLPAPNVSTADQSIGASATAYLTGSRIAFPTGRPAAVGTILRWTVSIAKSAAATATETWEVRFGTNGTTGDTARCSFTGDTETAVADEALVTVLATVRGPIGAAAVVQAIFCMEDNLTTTGFSNTARKAQVRVATSAGFDITPAGTGAGLVLTTGASHAITVRQVVAEVFNI